MAIQFYLCSCAKKKDNCTIVLNNNNNKKILNNIKRTHQNINSCNYMSSPSQVVTCIVHVEVSEIASERKKKRNEVKEENMV